MNIIKLTLNNWMYNAACILEEIEKLVIEHGGEIVCRWDRKQRSKYLVTNRRLNEAINEKAQRVEWLKRYDNPNYADAVAELEELQKIDNTPRELHYGEWFYISFALDGICYYYQLNDNPFFDFIYHKSRIYNGRVIRNCVCKTDRKAWLSDCFFSYRCTDADRIAAAKHIFTTLINASLSKCYSGKDTSMDKLFVIA